MHVQPDEPALEVDPVGQAVHWRTPAIILYVPAAQAWQEESSVVPVPPQPIWYWPAPQDWHETQTPPDDPAHPFVYWPGEQPAWPQVSGQPVACVACPTTAPHVPARQLMGTLDPAGQ